MRPFYHRRVIGSEDGGIVLKLRVHADHTKGSVLHVATWQAPRRAWVHDMPRIGEVRSDMVDFSNNGHGRRGREGLGCFEIER